MLAEIALGGFGVFDSFGGFGGNDGFFIPGGAFLLVSLGGGGPGGDGTLNNESFLTKAAGALGLTPFGGFNDVFFIPGGAFLLVIFGGGGPEGGGTLNNESFLTNEGGALGLTPFGGSKVLLVFRRDESDSDVVEFGREVVDDGGGGDEDEGNGGGPPDGGGGAVLNDIDGALFEWVVILLAF